MSDTARRRSALLVELSTATPAAVSAAGRAVLPPLWVDSDCAVSGPRSASSSDADSGAVGVGRYGAYGAESTTKAGSASNFPRRPGSDKRRPDPIAGPLICGLHQGMPTLGGRNHAVFNDQSGRAEAPCLAPYPFSSPRGPHI